MWLLSQEILWHVNTPIIKGLLTPPRLRSEKEFRITLQKIVLQSYAEVCYSRNKIVVNMIIIGHAFIKI